MRRGVGECLGLEREGSPSSECTLRGLDGLTLRLFIVTGVGSSCGSATGDDESDRDFRFLSRVLLESDGSARASAKASQACISSGVSICGRGEALGLRVPLRIADSVSLNRLPAPASSATRIRLTHA